MLELELRGVSLAFDRRYYIWIIGTWEVSYRSWAEGLDPEVQRRAVRGNTEMYYLQYPLGPCRM